MPRQFSSLGAALSVALIIAGAAAAQPSVVYPINGSLEGSHVAIQTNGLIAPVASENASMAALVHLPQAQQMDGVVLLEAKRASLLTITSKDEAMVDSSILPPIAPHMSSSVEATGVVYDNVRITVRGVESATQLYMRQTGDSDRGPTWKLGPTACEVRDAIDDRGYVFPADDHELSENQTHHFTGGEGRLWAHCEGTLAEDPQGIRHVNVYGLTLWFEADQEPGREIRTGTYSERSASVGGLVEEAVTQYLRVRAEGDEDVFLHAPAEARADVFAPRFDSAGSLTWPEALGSLSWGEVAMDERVPAMDANGIFTLAWGSDDAVAIDGQSTTAPPVQEPDSLANAIVAHSPNGFVPAAVGAGLILAALFAWGLYSRLQPERVLEHPTRAAMVSYARENPGAEVGEVARAVGVAWPNARQHLRRLESYGHVRVKRVAGRTAVFPREANGVGLSPAAVVLLRRESPRRMHELIIREPSLDQAGIAEALGIRQQSVSETLKRLIEAGLVEAEREGGRRTYRAVPLTTMQRPEGASGTSQTHQAAASLVE